MAWHRREVASALPFALFGLWTPGYMTELLANDLGTRLFGVTVQFSRATAAPLRGRKSAQDSGRGDGIDIAASLSFCSYASFRL